VDHLQKKMLRLVRQLQNRRKPERLSSNIRLVAQMQHFVRVLCGLSCSSRYENKSQFIYLVGDSDNCSTAGFFHDLKRPTQSCFRNIDEKHQLNSLCIVCAQREVLR
jgi:hypothetical protein